MPHYFTNDKVKSNEEIKKVIIDGTSFKFITDNGTFSKKGLDFGTRTLLESIDVLRMNGDVLDFGCGWGPIGIYIAKMTGQTVDMVDINERALNLAKKNADINSVKVNAFKSDIFSNVDKNYDYIVTNPPIRVGKKILYDILFSALKHLKKDGILYLVINKNQGAKSLIKDLEKEALVKLINKNKGFYIIEVKNR